MTQTGATVRAAVLGWPIEHSRSPAIHGHWLAKYGIDGTYTKIAVRPEDFLAFVKSLPGHGLVGANVTAPHKEAACRAADLVHPAAAAVGAANTLWLEAGKLHATNTDTYGFMAHLAASAPGWAKSNRPVAVLGAGGAARGIVYGLLEAGVAKVRLFNRTRERAEAIARHLGPRIVVHDWAERSERLDGAGLLVNTTTLGMAKAGPLDIDLARLPADAVVVDIVYVPLETALLKRARARGLAAVDGLGMLLHQAVPGFERWFGRRPEVTAELHALIAKDL
jgi:shikimate dehydrogenase